MDKKYAIVVEEAGENLSAYCPELPGCIATGRTMEDVIENMKEALAFHIQGFSLNLQAFL